MGYCEMQAMLCCRSNARLHNTTAYFTLSVNLTLFSDDDEGYLDVWDLHCLVALL